MNEARIKSLMPVLTMHEPKTSLSDEKKPQEQEVELIKYKFGSNCSGVVIDDYNSFIIGGCQLDDEESRLEDYELCINSYDAFLEKYPKIYCSADEKRSSEKTYIFEKDLLERRKVVKDLAEVIDGQQKLESLQEALLRAQCQTSRPENLDTCIEKGSVDKEDLGPDHSQ